MEFVQDRLADISPAMNLVLNEKVKTLKGQGRNIYHLGFGQSPFPVPVSAQESLKEHAGRAEYLPVKGLRSIREAIREFHSKLDSLNHFDEENIIIGPGSKELTFLLMNVIKGDVYLLSPTWTTYKPQVILSNKRFHVIETSPDEAYKLSAALLENALKDAKPGSLLIFCNPDNPTGTCYSRNELHALAQVIGKKKVLVLSDEIYARLTFNGQHSSISEVLPQQTIVSSGISKWASCGGWRLGYHMYPNELRSVLNAVEAFASNSYTSASCPVQYAAKTLFTYDDNLRSYVQHETRILSAVAEFCLRELVSAGVKISKPAAGYYMFPDFEPYRSKFKTRNIHTGTEMCDAILNEASVALLAGGPAFLQKESRLTVRLCFVNFDGKVAFEASSVLGLNQELPGNFVETHCNETVAGIQSIVRWLKSL